MNFEKDKHIDINQLHVEWIRQSELFANYAEALSKKEKEVKHLDERVKTIRSELILSANKNPEDCLGKDIKLTDAKVEAFYRTHERYQKAVEEHIAAEYERDMIKVAVDTFNYHRKPALENLVILFGQKYFAGPVVPYEVGQTFMERVEEKSIDTMRDKAVEQQSRRRRTKE